MYLKTFLKVNTIKVLSSFEQLIQEKSSQIFYSKPFDLHLKNYFKENKKLGSHDRYTIAELSYKMIRYKEFLDVISPKPLTWSERLETMISEDFNNQLKNENLSLNTRCSCPKELFNLLKQEYGELSAFNYSKAFLEKAPLTIRANPKKISRDELCRVLKRNRDFKILKCSYSPLGIKFLSERNVLPLQKNLSLY